MKLSPNGLQPVADVEIYCDSCGSPVGHTYTYSDAQGFYSLSWTPNGGHTLLVKKAGYDVVGSTGPYPDGAGTRSVIVNGDTRFDIQLVRR